MIVGVGVEKIQVGRFQVRPNCLHVMADSSGTKDSNKRRRLSSSHLIFKISDLPDEALAAVATFLPKPSRALFAVAMTTSPTEETNQIILSLKHPKGCSNGIKQRFDKDKEIWSTLDFADIDTTLASKLSDVDVRRVFIWIDAVHSLRTLKLTGCANITGSGLMPLMGSTVLEQIDLSIVKGNKTVPANEPMLRISEQCVVPILNSIVDATGNTLRHVQLPKSFRDRPSTIVDSFIEKYDELLEERGDKCSHCNEGFWGGMDGGGNPWVYDDHKNPLYGLQNYTCYECTDHVCANICLQFCTNCEKSYCTDCKTLSKCRYCNTTQLCKSCGEISACERCGCYACDSCLSSGGWHQQICFPE